MVRKPLGGLLACVLGVIILLENDVNRIFTIILQASWKIFIQNLSVQLPIHPPINFDSISRSFPQHTTPHYHRTSTKLQCSLNQPIIQRLSSLFIDSPPSI